MTRSNRKTVAAIIAVLAGILFVSGCQSGSTPSSAPQGASTTQEAPVAAPEPVSYDGVWKDDIFEATIDGDSIVINIVDADTKSLYWKGTFPVEGDKAVSVADREALDASLMGSGDAEKTFVLADTIDFEFTMMGTTKTVHLER